MKIILAYSGGLDTSVALKWLGEKYKAEVIAYCANIGQADDLSMIEKKALSTGASKVLIEDLREEFLENFCFKALQANAAYEGKYLLAAPMGRPLIAKRMVEIAEQEGADAVAHGATGKGNDQVRFYSSVVALNPNIEVLAPVIDWEMKSREAEIEYAKKHSIPISVTQEKPYSIDTNIWGSSIECGLLDDITLPPPEEIYQMTAAPETASDIAEIINIEFQKGRPVALNDKKLGAVELVQELNTIGGKHGIGRIDILENRVVGIKTRGIYESPAGTILHFAHRELESLVLDRDTLHYKEIIGWEYSKFIYYGNWFSPLREAFDAFIDYTQEYVTGEITLKLYKGQLAVVSRKSSGAMYYLALSTYDQSDTFDHSSGKGFSYIWSMPLRIANFAKMKRKSTDDNNK